VVQIENYMIMDRPEYNTDWGAYYEAMAEKADQEYQDRIHDEMMKEEEEMQLKKHKKVA